MSDSPDEIAQEFRSVVNMTAKQLENWLDTEESRRVGYKEDGEGESVGHHSGRKIIEILAKKKAEYTEADRRHMAKVVGYIHRHLAQRPEGVSSETPWRASLMNWGHDPLKSRTSGKAPKSRSES